MSAGTATELYLDRSATENIEGISTTRMFRVITTTSDDGPLIVLKANGLPDIGGDHPDDSDLWATVKTPAPESNDGFHWKVRVEYAMKPADSSASFQHWDRTPVVTTGFQSRQKVFERAYSYAETIAVAGAVRNNPLIPVVNQPLWQWFDPPAMIDEFLLVIGVQRWTRDTNFTAEDVYQYQNTINSAEIIVGGITIPALSGWVRSYRTSPASERDASSGSNTNYVTETIEIIVDPATWVKKIANMAVFKNSADSHYFVGFEKNVDTDGDAVRDPIRINLNGQPLPDPAGGVDNTVYLDFHGIWEENWTGMNLPNTYF